MPVRTSNGLVHLIRRPTGFSSYGVTVCGRRYAINREEKEWENEREKRGRIHRATPSNKTPTCVVCMARWLAGPPSGTPTTT